MSDALRAPEPEEPDESELAQAPLTPEEVARARELEEAQAAVVAVMDGVAEKNRIIAEKEARGPKRPKPLKLVLLLLLVASNLYLWLGNPEWLKFKEPAAPAMEYYQDSWKMAAYLQAQRIEEYRKDTGKVPVKVDDVRYPVHGVDYTRVSDQQYQLAAGKGASRVVYDSSQPLTQWIGRSIIRLGLIASGASR